MRYVAFIIVAALLVACDRDPYMAREGGYLPGEAYHHQSGLYPGMVVNRAGA
jgi:hypothetical protein